MSRIIINNYSNLSDQQAMSHLVMDFYMLKKNGMVDFADGTSALKGVSIDTGDTVYNFVDTAESGE